MVPTDGRPLVVPVDFLLRPVFKMMPSISTNQRSIFENLYKLIDGEISANETEIKNLLDPNRFNKVPF